jgi:hypothetical protein
MLEGCAECGSREPDGFAGSGSGGNGSHRQFSDEVAAIRIECCGQGFRILYSSLIRLFFILV